MGNMSRAYAFHGGVGKGEVRVKSRSGLIPRKWELWRPEGREAIQSGESAFSALSKGNARGTFSATTWGKLWQSRLSVFGLSLSWNISLWRIYFRKGLLSMLHQNNGILLSWPQYCPPSLSFSLLGPDNRRADSDTPASAGEHKQRRWLNITVIRGAIRWQLNFRWLDSGV